MPPAVLRGLGDRSYDKRKAAALEVTALIKGCQENGEKDRIGSVINLLAQEFARSRNIHHRKGGLIGLAASAIGLVPDIDYFLHLLIPPVLECFDDQEPRVCYYACESLYNISKVARTSVLRYFNQIFDGLCKLFAHVDVDVKNGANLLDRLIKDIVTETETFDIEAFIPLLQKHIKRTKPYIRQLLVGWIIVLDAVPDINMLDCELKSSRTFSISLPPACLPLTFSPSPSPSPPLSSRSKDLPDFLEGLFNMISDNNKEIKQSADNALAEFLREINEAEVVELGPMVGILVNQCRSKERSNRLTAMTWLVDFINLGKTRLLSFYASILGSIMHCISDPEPEIVSVTVTANHGLMNLVRSTTTAFDLNPLLHTLTVELLSEHVTTRVAALYWINMLHEKDAAEMNKSIGDLLPALLKTISDTADDVVLINLQVLARISLDEVQFLRVLNALVQLFLEDRPLLETRGALVIRKLCALLDCRSIYLALAAILNDEVSNLEFSSIMVQTLSLILLTAPELAPLRKTLKDCFTSPTATGQDRQVFAALFRSWTHNPVATFSLCLLAQAYDLSARLIIKFAESDVTVGFLMQVDKLVQLLESPIFLHLRLQLLEVNTPQHADLLRSLYGLLMLLPQSQAYKTLSDRLSTVSSLQIHLGFTGGAASGGSNALAPAKGKTAGSGFNGGSVGGGAGEVDYADLLQRFQVVQDRHVRERLDLVRSKSLRPVDQEADT